MVQFTENFINEELFVLVFSFKVEIFQFNILFAYDFFQNECNWGSTEWEISWVKSHKFDTVKPSIFNKFGIEVVIKDNIEQIYSLPYIFLFLISQLIKTGSDEFNLCVLLQDILEMRFFVLWVTFPIFIHSFDKVMEMLHICFLLNFDFIHFLLLFCDVLFDVF